MFFSFFLHVLPLYNYVKEKEHAILINKYKETANILEEKNIHSIVLAEKKYTKQITRPFTKLFANEYYVANLNASQTILQMLKNKKITTFFNHKYVLYENYFVVEYPLKNILGETIGHYLTFQDKDKCLSKSKYLSRNKTK